MSEIRAQRIAESIIGGGYGYQIPWDVVRRIDALIAPGDEEYVEAAFNPGDDAIQGVAVVLTATQVVFAAWSQSNSHFPSQTEHSKTRVETWSRKRLINASIVPLDDGRNKGGNDWGGDWGDQWPRDAAITLQYKDRAESLVLPLGSLRSAASRKRFREIVEGIISDLNR